MESREERVWDGGLRLHSPPSSTSTPLKRYTSSSTRSGLISLENSNGAGTGGIVPLMNGNTTLYIHGKGTGRTSSGDSRQALITTTTASSSSTNKRTSGTGQEPSDLTSTSAAGADTTEPDTDGLLYRSDSAHSLGALSYLQYDPKTTGSLSRTEEVNISLYDQGPHRRSYDWSAVEVGQGHGAEDTSAEVQWGGGSRASGDDGLRGAGRGGGAEQGQLVYSYNGEGNATQLNGHGLADTSSTSEKRSMRLTETVATYSSSSAINNAQGGNMKHETYFNHGSGEALSGSAEMSYHDTSSGRSAGLALNPEIDDSQYGSSAVGSNPARGRSTSPGELSGSSPSTSPPPQGSLDRRSTGRPRKPGLSATSPSGSFQMRAAYNSLPRNDSPKSPAASDDSFKASLQDTLTRNKTTAAAAAAGSFGGLSSSNTTTTTTVVSRETTGGGGNKEDGSATSHGAAVGGSKRSTSARSSTIETPKKPTGTDTTSKQSSSSKVGRAESTASNASNRKARGGTTGSSNTDLTKTPSTHSTSGIIGRPPSGKGGGRVSRTSSTAEPGSPRSSTSVAISSTASTSTSYPAASSGTPTKRTDSAKSNTAHSIKASSIERLAEPKRRLSVDKKERRGSVDSSSGRRTSASPASSRKGTGSSKGSSSGSKSTSKERQRSSGKEGQKSSVRSSTVSGATPGSNEKIDSITTTTTTPVSTRGGASSSKSVSQASTASSTVITAGSDHRSSSEALTTAAIASKVVTTTSHSASASPAWGGRESQTSTTITKSDSARSASRGGGFAAPTAASSARRTESSSSRTSSKAPSRSGSGAAGNKQGRGKFSIKAAGSAGGGGSSVSPPGSVFDIAGAEPEGTAVPLSGTTHGATPSTGKPKRTSSTASQRKVTAALSRNSSKASQAGEVTGSGASTTTTTTPGRRPARTSSLVKAETKHRAISKSLFSELHATKRADTSVAAAAGGVVNDDQTKLTRIEYKSSDVTPIELVTADNATVTERLVTKTVVATTTTRGGDTGAEDDGKSRRSSLLEKRGSKRDSLNLDLSTVSAGKTEQVVETTTTTDVTSPGQFYINTSERPLSPSVEAKNAVTYGTVDRLVKGKFKDLNLTARLLDSASLERPNKVGSPGGQEEVEEKRYRFLVEGIDVPTSPDGEENKGVFVGAEEGAAGDASIHEVHTVTTTTTQVTPTDVPGATDESAEQKVENTTIASSTTPTHSPTSPDGGGSSVGGPESEPNSLERSRRPKRGFTYILDENVAREVTKRASTLTARRPHEQADRVHESKVSTLEREREEKALKDARANLTKAQIPDKPPTVVGNPTQEQEAAFNSVLRGIKQRTTREGAAGGDTGGVGSSSSPPATAPPPYPGRPLAELLETKAEVYTTTSVTSSGQTEAVVSQSSRSQVSGKGERVKKSLVSATNIRTVSDQTDTGNMSVKARVSGGRVVSSSGAASVNGGNMGQLSPDSAYQSDSATSPGFDNNKLSDIKQLYHTGGSQLGAASSSNPQEVTVQRLQQEQTVGQGVNSRYESNQTVLSEHRKSEQTRTDPGDPSKRTHINQYSTSTKSTKTTVTSSSSDNTRQEEPYVVTTRSAESVVRGGSGAELGATDANNNTPGGSTEVGALAGSSTNFRDRFRPAEVQGLVRQEGAAARSSRAATSATTTTTTSVSSSSTTGKTREELHNRRHRREKREYGAATASTHTATTESDNTEKAPENGNENAPVHGDHHHQTGAAHHHHAELGEVVTSGLAYTTDVRGKREEGEAGEGAVRGGSGGEETQSGDADARRYLPVGEDGGVHITVGGAGGSTEHEQPDSSSHTEHTGESPGMRVKNKENVSSSHRVVRESQYTTTSGSGAGGGAPGLFPGGGSERHPLGQHSSFTSSDTYSTVGSRGGGINNRVIPLAPLTVDINTHNDSFEMATHPTSITSPTVKHATTMYEMSEMNRSYSNNDGYYDGPYGGSLPHPGHAGSRYVPGPRPPQLEDGLDFQNLHNLRNTYQEQTLSSQQSYRSGQTHDLTDGSGGGFDTVSRSFRHIPGTPSGPKYLRVDGSSNGGPQPMSSYQDEREGYRSGIRGYQGRSSAAHPSQQNESYVSRTYVEGDGHMVHRRGLHGDSFDGDSVKSEPAYNRTRRSEKILSNRRPARRHASSLSGPGSSQTLPTRHVRLDRMEQEYGPSSGGYLHSSSTYGGGVAGMGGGGDASSTLRSQRSHSTNMLYSPRSGEPVIEPQLKDAQKMKDPFGNEYHITLKLKDHSVGTADVSRASLDHHHHHHSANRADEERYASLQHQQRDQSHHGGDMYNSSMSLPDMHYQHSPATPRGPGGYEEYSYHTRENHKYHYGDEGYGGSPTRTVTQVELDSQAGRQQFEDRLSWYRARKAQQQEEENQRRLHGLDVVDSGQQHHYSHHHAPASHASSDFTMNLGQSMSMDYVPATPQHTHTETVQVVAPERPSKTNIFIRDDSHTNLNASSTFTATQEDPPEDGEELPQVVRGSILIKNTIDTTGAPKVFDVVAESGDDDEFTVESNTNVFHGKYLQARENPMYNSDEDLSRLQRRPAFTRIFNRDEEDYTEIPVDYTPQSRKSRGSKTTTTTTTASTKTSASKTSFLKGMGKDYFVNGQWQVRNGRDYTDSSDVHERTIRMKGMPPMRDTKKSTEMEIARLIQNAPADSVKQRINVEREEEEIMGPLPVNHADGEDGDPSGMLNFDTISEKVDVGLSDGVAQLAVKVRCERIVPIRGVDDLFKKSSVIVTRLIEIDLGVTEERKRLYDNVMRGGSSQAMLEGEGGNSRRTNHKGERKLGTKETFKLYKMFMGIAEAEEGKRHDSLNIEQRIDEDQHIGADFDFDTEGIHQDGFDYDEDMGFDMTDLDSRLERKINHSSQQRGAKYADVQLEAMPGGRGHLMKNPEPDTISYISQASEQSDLLY